MNNNINPNLPTIPAIVTETIEEGLEKWVKVNHTNKFCKVAVDRILFSYKDKGINLKLSGLNLGVLPPEIGRLANLQMLELAKNQLTVLPTEIFNLSKLQALELNLNQLTSIPSEIGNLEQLKMLNLYKNQLTFLPSEIINLTKLKDLYISSNQFTVLPPSICKLTQLQELVLSSNQLTILPPEFGNLLQLRVLYLSNNQLTCLPREIGNLTQLQGLFLNNNPLTVLPQEIGNLTLLQTLNLENNHLTSLPTEIGNLASLELLYLQANRNLCSLPMTLGNCQNLTYIDLEEVGVNVPGAVAIIAREGQAIHDRAQAIRRTEGVLTLPSRLDTWKAYGKVNTDFGFLSDEQLFSQKQQCDINEWLVRLERCEDFKYKREELAKLVCKILVTLKDSIEFKDAFFSKVEGNLECCDDRASMLLNTIYTDLMLYTIDTVNTDKQKLELLVSLAKTLALRETLEKMILRYELETKTKLSEDVEIYLYHEIKHKSTLNLLTAIDNMHYSDMGRAPNVVNEQELLDTVTTKYFDIFANLDQAEKILVNYPAFMREKSAIERASEEEMGIVFEREYQTDQLKIDAMNAIVAKKNADILALKKEHVKHILKL